MSEIHFHRHIIDQNNEQIFVFNTSNPFLKNYLYRIWSRNETLKYLEQINNGKK